MRLRLYGVLSHEIATIVEVFQTWAEAEELVATWNRDEPGHSGCLEVVALEFDYSTN